MAAAAARRRTATALMGLPEHPSSEALAAHLASMDRLQQAAAADHPMLAPHPAQAVPAKL